MTHIANNSFAKLWCWPERKSGQYIETYASNIRVWGNLVHDRLNLTSGVDGTGIYVGYTVARGVRIARAKRALLGDGL